MIRLEELLDQPVLYLGRRRSLRRRLAEKSQTVRVTRTPVPTPEFEIDPDRVSDLSQALHHLRRSLGADSAELLLPQLALVDAARRGILVEIVRLPGDGESVVFPSRVGLLVERDGLFESSLADVTPLDNPSVGFFPWQLITGLREPEK